MKIMKTKDIDNDINLAQIDIRVYWKDGYTESWTFNRSSSKRKVWKAIIKFFRKESDNHENI